MEIFGNFDYDYRKDLFKDIDFEGYFLKYNIIPSDTVLSYYDITKEHYHLLGYMSTMVNDSVIIDTGTHRGSSALALSYNQSNKVLTYDIERFRGGIDNNIKNIPSNIESNCNMSITDLIKSNPQLVLGTSLFFLDINHEGPDEIEVFDFLLSNNYKGILILDDIHYNNQMEQVWDYVKSNDVLTLDVTKYGHLLDSAGTGIVVFNKSHELLQKLKKTFKLSI
jgi:fibronectin type 3 domain-containing protein